MASDPRDVRCGKEEEHPEHEHWQGHCDGQPVDPALVAGPSVPVTTLYGASAHPRPWTWSSLTVAQARELGELLDRFAAHYNRTYVVDDRHLILGCWPLHPGLAHELAVIYALWVDATSGPGALSPDKLGVWHDRWLPGFQERLPRWYGVGIDVCRPGEHVDDWNPATAKLKAAGHRPESMDVGDAVRELVANEAYLDGT